MDVRKQDTVAVQESAVNMFSDRELCLSSVSAMDVDSVPSTSENNRSSLSVAVVDIDWSSRIHHGHAILQLMRSRMMFLRVLSVALEEGKRKKRKRKHSRNGTFSTTMDLTTCTADFKKTANAMWRTVENYQIQSLVLRSSIFSLIGQEVAHFQQTHLRSLPVFIESPAVGIFLRSVYGTSFQLFQQCQKQNEMLVVRDFMAAENVQKQEMHDVLFARVTEEMAERKSGRELTRREKVKVDKRKIHIKLARNLINTLLAFNDIDYTAKPEMKHIKEKHRAPLSF